jgi:aminopeptidase-like protein
MQDRSKNISNLLAFCDGSLDLIDIANILKIFVIELAVVAKELESIGLLRSILGKN